ncbi:MAG: hypothetical protein EKK37_15025 [Sphingobacteriales bacterium]|nr:MAG: hypothetical protein EKK37_15025 [Sphingobacteriales bacterium]
MNTLTLVAQQLRLVVPVGHTSSIADVCFNPVKNQLATIADDNTVKIWDIGTGQLLQTLYGHKAIITRFFFTSDGNYLITASFEDGDVKIWEMKTGAVKINFTVGNRYLTENIQWLATIGEKKMLILDGSSINLWDIESSKMEYNFSVKEADKYSNSFYKAAVSNDKKTLATATTYGDSVFVWDIGTRKIKAKFIIDGFGNEYSIKFSPDDKYLYLLTYHGFSIFNIRTGKKKFESIQYGSLFMKPTFDKNVRYLFTASKYNPMRERGINLDTGLNDNKNFAPAITDILLNKTTALKVPSPLGDIRKVDFDNKGKHLFVTTTTGFFIYSITGNQCIKTGEIKESNYNIIPVFYIDPEGRYLLKTAEENAILYNIKGQKNHSIKGNMFFEPNQYFSADGRFIYTTSGNSGKYAWDISGGKFTTTNYDTTTNFNKKATEDKIKPYPVLDSLKGMWQIITGKDSIYLKGRMDYTPAVVLSNTKKFIATYRTRDSLLRIWNAVSGELIHRIFCKYGSPESVAFSYNDSLLIWGSGSAYINSEELDKMWDNLQKEIDNTDTTVNKPVIKEDPVIAKTSNGRSPDLINLISLATGKPLFEVEDSSLPRSYVRTGFSVNYKYIYALTGFITIWDSKNFSKIISIENNCVNSLPGWAISPDGKKVLISCDNNSVLYEAFSNRVLFTLPGAVSFADFSENGKYILTEAPDKQLKIWNTATGRLLYTYYALENGNFLLTDEYGRYDGTEDARKKVYYVCGDEIIDLDQVKDKLWVPNLAERIMKGDTINAPTLAELEICNLTPLVETKEETKDHYQFQITPRRGGLGDVIVSVNNIESYRLTNKELQKNGNGYLLKVDKKAIQNYFVAGETNNIHVKALTASNDISSRSTIIEEQGSPASNKAAPNLYAVIVGVSDYKGTELDLRYAAKDANDIAGAIDMAAKKLLNTDDKNHVFVYKVHTAEGHDLFPEKNSIKKVISDIGTKAQPNDILLIFFAGHGKWDKDKNQFFFITADASKETVTSAIADVGISTQELSDWIQPSKMKAQKRIMVFDACNSGQAIKDLVKIGNDDQKYLATRDDEKAEQIKAVEKMNNKSGLFILSASASNQYAYEMGKYSQGLLTYSLLKVMKEQPEVLDDRKYLNVLRWFDAAEKSVSNIAAQNGNQQQPQLVSANNFTIGLVDDEVRNKIKLPGEKPVFSASNFQNSDEDIAADNLGFNKRVDNILSDISTRSIDSKISYLPYSAADAYNLSGRYTIAANNITIKVNVRKNNQTQYKFEVTGTTVKPDELAQNITSKVLDWLSAQNK